MNIDEMKRTRADSVRLFDAIARRYDLMNAVLSLGMASGWRSRMAQFLPEKDSLKVLDAATGTADVPVTLALSGRSVTSIVGVDPSREMLNLGAAKLDRLNLSDRVSLLSGDLKRLQFPDGTFDVVTVAFGLRNMDDFMPGLIEIHRVLKDGGRVILLEFSLPSSLLVRPFHWAYLRLAVPVVGLFLTGNVKAYSYLSRTIFQFPCGEQFLRILRQAGFRETRQIPLLMGTTTIYLAEK